MLTNHLAGALCHSRPFAQIGVAIVLFVAATTCASAGGVGAISCLGDAPKSFDCAGRWDITPGDPHIRLVPDAGEAQHAALKERDRKWLAHCRPVVERDGFGVARYRYSSPGCEFGIGAD